jgi:hypothetical protein
MWNWLVGLLHKLDRWMHRGTLPSAHPRRSNLHGRYR